MKVSCGTFQCECDLKQKQNNNNKKKKKKKQKKKKKKKKKREPNFYYTKLYVKVWKQLKISGNISKT